MLKKLKIFIWDLVWSYYHDKANYCYGKIDCYGPENNAKWEKRANKYVKREIEVYGKLVYLKYGGGC